MRAARIKLNTQRKKVKREEEIYGKKYSGHKKVYKNILFLLLLLLSLLSQQNRRQPRRVNMKSKAGRKYGSAIGQTIYLSTNKLGL